MPAVDASGDGNPRGCRFLGSIFLLRFSLGTASLLVGQDRHGQTEGTPSAKPGKATVGCHFRASLQSDVAQASRSLLLKASSRLCL